MLAPPSVFRAILTASRPESLPKRVYPIDSTNMPKKRRASQAPHINKSYVTGRVHAYFHDDPNASIDCRTIAADLGVRDNASRHLITECLYELADRGVLREEGHGRFVQAHARNEAEGRISILRTGDGIFMLENGAEVEIPLRYTANALDGDTVRIAYRLTPRSRHIRGEVLEILRRARETFVGLLQIDRRRAILIPDNRQMPYDIFIPLTELHGGQHGQKAEVRITDWPLGVSNPTGTVVEVLGDAGVHEVEMHAILSEFSLPYRYPAELEAEANRLEEGITPEEIARRRDMRTVPTLTIDPDTAKDFDDALSFRQLENGNLEVGVHIADVTHYVKPDSAINDEAASRATSVYLVDRTVPMLPERLCNEICSLRPNEDKLAFSVIFQMTPQAQVVDRWFGRTVIRSQARLTYAQAQRTVESGQGEMATEILALNGLAQVLRAKRFEEGAIDFAAQEVRFQLDAQGAPVGVLIEESNEAHQLIEEFMLLANRTVAEFVGQPPQGQKPRPFVYRVHDRPNQEKLESLCTILAQLGRPYRGDITRMDGKAITAIINSVRGYPEQHMIDMLAIRSMAKAIYSTHNIGHFGLAFPYYTHFTSPIRRYPDMMVHRILADVLQSQPSTSLGELDTQCENSSEMEKRAAEAERASIRYKQVEYLKTRYGQPFEGIITGVADFGFFVELSESKCEGLVAMRDMTDDYYVFDAESFSLTGRTYRRRFRLGDPVKVEVLRTDLALRRIDFAVIEHQGEPIEHLTANRAYMRRSSSAGRRSPSSSSKGSGSSSRQHGKAKRRR